MLEAGLAYSSLHLDAEECTLEKGSTLSLC